MFLHGSSRRRPLQDKAQSIANRKNKKYVLYPVSALTLSTPAMHFQRACRQCVHESARLSRVMCSHAWYSRNRGERQNYRFSLCPLPHALATHYFLRLTRARGKRYIREGNALLCDFWYFSSQKSTIKEKLL